MTTQIYQGIITEEIMCGVMKDCSICFDPIGQTNCCALKCGHEFCFTCISRYIATTAKNDITQDITCPMCRDILIEGDELEDDEEDEEGDDEYDTESEVSEEFEPQPDEDGNIINMFNMFHEPQDDDEIYDDQDENVANIEVVTQKLVEKGFSMLDLASILFNRYKRSDPKYTTRYINRMIENIYEVIDELDEIADSEYNEREMFAREDVRVA